MVNRIMLILALFHAGCAHRPVIERLNYSFYILDLQSKTLNGPTPDDDLPLLTTCWTDENYKCVVMITDEFYKMKEELQELRGRDNVCQKYMRSLD